MSLPAFLRMLRRRAWSPIAFALLGTGIGLVLALSMAPAFEGITRLRLDVARPADFGQTQATRELLASSVEDIRTHDMADATAARLGEDWLAERGMSAGDLHGLLYAGKLRVSSHADTYEIKIGARHPDPAIAEAISLQWAETFVDRREKANLERDEDARVEAVIRDDTTNEQYAPRRRLIVGAAAAAGLLLGSLLMLLLEYLQSATLRDARDAEAAVDAPVLALLAAERGSRSGSWLTRSGLPELLTTSGSLLRLGLPVLLLASLGAGAAFLMSSAQPTVYRARARIALEPANPSSWGNAQAIREIMRGYKEDIKTYQMARKVNERLQLDQRERDLLDPERLNVAEDVGIYEVRIDVFDRDPDQAAALAGAWADVFIETHRVDDLRRDQQDRILVRLRDEQIQTAPWSPKPMAASLAGAVLGALAGLVALWSKQLRRAPRLGSGGDAAATGGALLGRIPRASSARGGP